MPRSPLMLLVLLAGLTGCGGHTGSAVSPVAPPVSSAAATSAAATSADEAGRQACDLLKQAVDGATLMNPGVVQAIRAASSAADAPMSDAAGRLLMAYTTAVAAHGRDNEPDAVAAVSRAAVEMKQTCADAGLETVG